MSINATTCANWREHVILSCPSIEEMKTIAQTLGTADAKWTELKTMSGGWMDAMIGSLAEFMDTDELDAFIVRINRFFYLEAMKAGQAFRQSTGALLDRPPESGEKWDAVNTAMVAGAFRTAFEGICGHGLSWFPIGRDDHDKIASVTTTTTHLADPVETIPQNEHRPVIAANG